MNRSKFGALAALLCGFFVCAAVGQSTTQPSSPREKLLMDFGWRFALGHAQDTQKDFGFGETYFFNAKAGFTDGPAAAQFDDRGWRQVDLPHDWAVELPFDEHADGGHGAKPIGRGFPQNSVGWYRKKFNIPASDAGKRIRIEFDGVFRDSLVFINGFRFGPHESGYTSFGYDISEVLNYGGENTIAVRVDASQKEGWFYEGAGIYRHVWLSKTSPLHVAPSGMFVSSAVKENSADVTARTTISNDDKMEATFNLEQTIIDSTGKPVVEPAVQEQVKLAGGQTQDFSTTISLANPQLWSLESPNLYKLITTIHQGDAITDRVETTFGIRTLQFDKDKGFFLNGQHVLVQGTCNHQDHAGVGSAMPDSLQEFRIKQLKAMGCNAIRTSHNPPTPEMLDACDRLGMLVMDETRQEGSDPQSLDQLRDFMMRDRNHPCVFIWSLGNEEWGIEGNPRGTAITAVMNRVAHSLDSTRKTTLAISGGWETGSGQSIDVMGFNYFVHGDVDHYHAKYHDQPTIGSEEASTFSTRGIYFDDLPNAHLSAYDVHGPKYGSTAERWVNFYSTRPFVAGAFVWTGFDYRGEPTPFGWPAISSQFGILDTCGFPKDNFYYYQSCWTDAPMVHLLPHWNWAGKEGQEIEVWCFSNCDEVELLLNDKSLGRQPMPRLSHLQWNVKYQPGVLLARGYKIGKQVAEDKVETTGAPAAIQLQADRSTLAANGEDAAMVKVSVVDSQGRAVPNASNEIQFAIDGPGKIIGVGNGDPSSHEPDKFIDQVQSLAIGDWRMTKIDDVKNRPETAENFDDANWRSVFTHRDDGQPRQRVSTDAVYRGSVELPAINIAWSMSLLLRRFGDEQWVYLNGKQIAHMSDGDHLTIDLHPSDFHAGKNSIAVVATPRHGSREEISRDENFNSSVHVVTSAGSWKRSLFEGLAQVIVQTDRQGGEITLTATSNGLTAATLKLQSQPMSK